MIRKRFLAFLLTAALTLSVAAPAYAIGEADSDAHVTYADLAAYGVENSASNAAVNLGQALRMLFQTAGMDNSWAAIPTVWLWPTALECWTRISTMQTRSARRNS